MSKRSAPGNSVVSRLSRRSQGGLYRRQMPGGGEVYTGPTATQALRSLGARAFTMDNTIFVAEDFDDSNPEDQALYAHERHHALNSGGDGAARSYYDAEELAARAIERMVLHRSSEGEDFGSILRSVESNRIQREADVMRCTGGGGGGGDGAGNAGGKTSKTSKGNKTGEAAVANDPNESDEAAEAYAALLAHGRTHESIVQELADEAVWTIGRQNRQASMQGGSTGFV